MIGRVITAGYAFICPDYRLIPSGGTTGHAILEDIVDVFAFLHRTEFDFSALDGIDLVAMKLRVDADKIGVAGSSAGGLCAYLAAIHASPKPKAVLSMYGMGGDFFVSSPFFVSLSSTDATVMKTPHYLAPKIQPFFRGRELLDPVDFPEHLFPFPASNDKPVSDSPLSYHPDTYVIPGYPANPRMLLARLYLQLGSLIDYYTGDHEPSLSNALRSALEKFGGEQTSNSLVTEVLRDLIPSSHQPIFPQLNITSTWPPTLLIHGSADSAVPVQESRHVHSLLDHAGVRAELLIVEGEEHSFDYAEDAESRFEVEFGRVEEWLDELLS